MNRGLGKSNVPNIQNVLAAQSEKVITFLKLQFSHLCTYTNFITVFDKLWRRGRFFVKVLILSVLYI